MQAPMLINNFASSEKYNHLYQNVMKAIISLILSLCACVSLYAQLQPDSTGTALNDSLSVQLQELTVEAPRAAIRRQGMDYTVSNLEGSFLGDAGTVMDLLKWLPGLIVNGEDDIRTNDQKTIGDIYIDEQKVVDRSQLGVLASNRVSKVEVIRDQSARYPKPVIKITLKKSLKDYLGLSVTNTTWIRRRLSDGLRANVNAKWGKLAFDGSVSGSVNNSKAYDSNHTTVRDPRDGSVLLDNLTDGGFTTHSTPLNWNAGINYFATPQLTLIAQYSGNTWRKRLTSQREHQMLYHGSESVIKEQHHGPRDRSWRHNATVGLIYQPTDSRTLTFTLSYARSNSKSDTEIFLTPSDGDASVNASSRSTRYNLWDGEINYAFPLLGSTIELGSNMSWINNRYDYIYNGVDQPSKRDDFTGAWYASWQRRWSDRWDVKLGLRLEHNDSRLDFGNTSSHDRHTGLRPFGNVDYTINDRYQVGASYTMWNGYPTISQLNPAVVYYDTLHYSAGNPELKQYTGHYLRLYANLRDFNLWVAWSHSNHDIFNATMRYGDDGAIIDRPINSRYTQSWSGGVSYSHRFGHVSIDPSVYYSFNQVRFYKVGDYLNRNLDNHYVMASIQANWKFSDTGELYGSFRYVSPMQVDLTRCGRTLSATAGYMQRFFDRRLRVKVEMQDIFAQAITPRWSMDFGHVHQYQRNRYDIRCLNIQVQYVFNTLNNRYRNARIDKQSTSRAD